jgi:hypothetical protein
VAEQRRGSEGTLVEERDANAEERAEARAEARGEARDAKVDRDNQYREVRATDIEPYTGLRYLSKLFRFMSVILVLLLVAEVATGIYTQGSASIPTLLGEASRLIVLAGVLWGTGDLAHLLIDVGHDVRASRILVARVAHVAKVAPLSATRVPISVHDRPQVDGSGVAFADRPVPRRNVNDHLGSDDDNGPPIP